MLNNKGYLRARISTIATPMRDDGFIDPDIGLDLDQFIVNHSSKFPVADLFPLLPIFEFHSDTMNDFDIFVNP
ncbi:MAG: hypothetical protein ACXAD7_26070 [Candidatus Kariarchaeaceae archaeon]